MRPAKLVLRCYASFDDGQWSAVCVDLALAAQSDSCDEAIEKLGQQIRSYVSEALVGEDKAHAYELMTRKAPLSLRAKYHYARFCSFLNTCVHRSTNVPKSFISPLPLRPA